MRPISPVLPLSESMEQVYGKAQPEYIPLPVFRTKYAVISRWELTDDERRHLAQGGDLFISLLNFGGPLMPFLPIAAEADTALKTVLEMEENLTKGQQ